MDWNRIACTLGLVILGGCKSVAAVHDEPDPCVKWQKLAEVVGCTPSPQCEKLTPRCEDEAAAMIDCAADAFEYCYCESDDDELNCEGTWKPSEGSGECASAQKAFRACSSQ
jgi:hypothetical protein